MAKGPITWRDKVRTLVGYPKRGAVPRLARLLGKKRETVRNWLEDDRSPHNEAEILALLAQKLHVPPSWLTDGKDGPPLHIPAGTSAEWIEMVDRAALPPAVKQVIYAVVGDPGAAAWLAEAYARLYLPTRGQRAAVGAR